MFYTARCFRITRRLPGELLSASALDKCKLCFSLCFPFACLVANVASCSTKQDRRRFARPSLANRPSTHRIPLYPSKFVRSFSRIGYESPLSPAGSYVTTITMLKSSFLASLHFTRACYSFVALYGPSVESASGSSRIHIVRHIQANGETKSVTIALRGGLPSARSVRVCLVNSNRMVAGMRAMYEETTFGKEGEKSLEGLNI